MRDAAQAQAAFEREAILTDQLTAEERDWVNNYHRQVYETLAPLLDEETRAWLAAQTALM